MAIDDMRKARASKKDKRKKLLVPKHFTAGFMLQLDQRGKIYKSLAKELRMVVNDLGGIINLSQIQIVLCERFVFLTYMVRLAEQNVLTTMNTKKGNKFRKRWLRYQSSLHSIGKTLGVEKKTKVENLRDRIKLTEKVG